MHARTHACMHARTQTHTRTHIHIHTHTYTHTHTHIHTRTHAHKQTSAKVQGVKTRLMMSSQLMSDISLTLISLLCYQLIKLKHS